jgi:DNA-binding NtrC family response regulator
MDQGVRVLVAFPDPALRRLLWVALQRTGLCVALAADWPELERQISKAREAGACPDALIVSLELSGGGTSGRLQWLRAALPQAPIFVVVAIGDGERWALRPAPARTIFVEQPFDVLRLRSDVLRACSGAGGTAPSDGTNVAQT